MPFIVRREDGYQDRDRYAILTLFTPGETWKAWAAAAAVEPQGADHPRRRLRCELRARPSRRSRTPPAPSTRSRAAARQLVRRGAAPRLRGDVDGAGQHRPQLQRRAQRRVADDGQGAARRALRHDPLHHRHRLQRRLGRAAHRRQRLPRHLPGPGHHLLLPRRDEPRLAVRRLPPDARLLRGPDVVGPGRRVGADPDRRRRGPPHARSTRSPPTRASSRSAINPETDCAGVPAPVAGDTRTRFDSETNPGGRALRHPHPDAQPARAAPRVGVERPGEGGRARLRRPALRQRRRAVRPQGARGRAASRPSSSSTSTRRSAASTSTPTPIAVRTAGDPASIANAYRTGLLNEFTNTSQIAMINHGGPDPGHRPRLRPRRLEPPAAAALAGPHRQPRRVVRPDAAARRRAVADRGVHRDGRLAGAGREGQAVGAAGDEDRRGQAGVADRPLPRRRRAGRGVPRRHRRGPTCRPRARRPAARPPTTCWPARCEPIDRSSYLLPGGLPVPFTDAQWARLQAVFPDGVCQWALPGIGQGPAEDVAGLRHRAPGDVRRRRAGPGARAAPGSGGSGGRSGRCWRE